MKTRTALLLAAAIFFGIVGFLLLISEPVEGECFDSPMGFVLMKGGAILNLVLVALAWAGIEKPEQQRIESWIKLHFS